MSDRRHITERIGVVGAAPAGSAAAAALWAQLPLWGSWGSPATVGAPAGSTKNKCVNRSDPVTHKHFFTSSPAAAGLAAGGVTGGRYVVVTPASSQDYTKEPSLCVKNTGAPSPCVAWAPSCWTEGAAKKPPKMSEIDDCARLFDHFSFVAKQLWSSTCGFVNRKSVECAQVVHNRQSRSFLAKKWQRPTLCRYDERGRYQAAADKGGACQAWLGMPDSLRPRPSMGRPTLLLIFLVSALLSADSRSSWQKVRNLRLEGRVLLRISTCVRNLADPTP